MNGPSGEIFKERHRRLRGAPELQGSMVPGGEPELHFIRVNPELKAGSVTHVRPKSKTLPKIWAASKGFAVRRAAL